MQNLVWNLTVQWQISLLLPVNWPEQHPEGWSRDDSVTRNDAHANRILYTVSQQNKPRKSLCWHHHLHVETFSASLSTPNPQRPLVGEQRALHVRKSVDSVEIQPANRGKLLLVGLCVRSLPSGNMARERPEDVHLVQWRHTMVVAFLRFDPAGGLNPDSEEVKVLGVPRRILSTTFEAHLTSSLLEDELCGFGVFLTFG